jgi:hypothetical protein
MAAPSNKTADWIAFVSDSPPGGFGSTESRFTDWFTSEEHLRTMLKVLANIWLDAPPDWQDTSEQLCTSTDDPCEERRQNFLESLDNSAEEPSEFLLGQRQPACALSI